MSSRPEHREARTRHSLVPDGERWRRHVEGRAGDWYPGIWAGSARRVRLEHTQSRLNTIQYRMAVEGEHGSVRVVVKQTDVNAPFPNRPVLGLADDQRNKHRTEWRALKLLEERVAPLPGLAAVRGLQHLPEEGTLILEWLPSTTFGDLLSPTARLRGNSRERQQARMMNMGRLVRLLHGLPAPNDSDLVPPVRESTVEEYCRYLELHLGPDPVFRRLRDRADDIDVGLWHGPVGLHHGDLAPRNFLLSDRAEVACIDMLARYMRPVAADLAYLRVGLAVRMDPAGVTHHRGRGTGVEAAENAFLRGYLDEPGAGIRTAGLLHLIDAHEAVVLLDRLAATAVRNGPERLRSRARRVLLQRIIRRRLDFVSRRLATDGA